MQNSLEPGNQGSVHTCPCGADIHEKDAQASSHPLDRRPLYRTRVTAVVEAEGPHGRELYPCAAGPRALLTGPSPTPRLLLLLFTPESHPGDTWLQCGPSPPERHAPHMLLGSQQGLTAFSGVE